MPQSSPAGTESHPVGARHAVPERPSSARATWRCS
jgi:hypothetical protein